MNILKECENARTIGISGHVRPDGDCVGACLSLYQYLKNNIEGADIKVFLEKPGDEFSFLTGFEDIDTSFEGGFGLDVYFALDCSGDRLGAAEAMFNSATKKINIDHHVTNNGMGDVNVVKPEIGSCCEVLYGLYEKEKITREIAEAIYVGMVHDTGVFQYSNTTPDTYRIAAELISYGFNFSKIIQESFYQKTYLQAQILGRALMESIRFFDGKCIVSCVDRKTMDFYNVTPHEFEGIVNQLKNIEGVDCAIFMYECNTLEFKVSLRTSEKVDAAKVAISFGGGGHVRAAGCTMKGTFHDCVNNLSARIEEQLC